MGFKAVLVGAATGGLVLATAGIAHAEIQGGSISCSKIAAVQSKTLGQTTINPPGEGPIDRGNSNSVRVLQTFESNPNDGAWYAQSPTIYDASTYAYCSSLSW